MSNSIGVLEPSGELTPQMIRDMLGLAGLDVAERIIDAWTPNERALAYDYAMRQHMRASDDYSVRPRDMPWFLAMSVVASAPGAVIVIPDELSRLFSHGTGAGAAERNATLQRPLSKPWGED